MTDHPSAAGDRPAPLRRAFHHTSQGLGTLAAVGVVVTMLATVTDVARRTTTGRALPGTVDYSELLMVAVVFLALAMTQRDGGHVSVNLVTARLPDTVARWMRVTGLLVAAVLMLWLTVAATQEAIGSYARNEIRFGLLRIPVWPARAAIPVGCAALVLELVASITDVARSDRPAALTTHSTQRKAEAGPGLEGHRL